MTRRDLESVKRRLRRAEKAADRWEIATSSWEIATSSWEIATSSFMGQQHSSSSSFIDDFDEVLDDFDEVLDDFDEGLLDPALLQSNITVPSKRAAAREVGNLPAPPNPKPGGVMQYPLRRNSQDSKVRGVCGGIARSYGFDPIWARLAFIGATLLSGGWGILAYAILGFVMRDDDDLYQQALPPTPEKTSEVGYSEEEFRQAWEEVNESLK